MKIPTVVLTNLQIPNTKSTFQVTACTCLTPVYFNTPSLASFSVKVNYESTNKSCSCLLTLKIAINYHYKLHLCIVRLLKKIRHKWSGHERSYIPIMGVSKITLIS